MMYYNRLVLQAPDMQKVGSSITWANARLRV